MVATQAPVTDPVSVTEGVLLVLMHRDGFYITSDLWVKFYVKYPRASFDEFWDNKLRKYEARNAAAKQFFRAFSRDRIKHHRVLLACWTKHEVRRLGHIREGMEYSAPLGLVKAESVEEGEIGPPSYTCKGQSPF